ncbi:MAG TPA: hypothetical protein VKR42_05855, partial [Ktedonobacteraceae bacterium]|nr:hypothetical protein [Ktedonobacteraceae bacterium]
MAEKNDFFLPDDIERQIESIRQHKEGDRVDAEAMAYLRSYYQTDARQEQEALDRMWNRIASTALFEEAVIDNKKDNTMQNPSIGYSNMSSLRQSRRRRSTLMQRLGILVAAVFLVALVASMALVFYTIRHNTGNTGSPGPTAPISTNHVPLKVTSVTMTVTPGSLAGLSCGSNLTVTYTATFHVVPNSVGGPVKFTYSTNGGRGQTPASITFNPGQTTKSYQFTSSGALSLDHTYPG